MPFSFAQDTFLSLEGGLVACLSPLYLGIPQVGRLISKHSPLAEAGHSGPGSLRPVGFKKRKQQ